MARNQNSAADLTGRRVPPRKYPNWPSVGTLVLGKAFTVSDVEELVAAAKVPMQQGRPLTAAQELLNDVITDACVLAAHDETELAPAEAIRVGKMLHEGARNLLLAMGSPADPVEFLACATEPKFRYDPARSAWYRHALQAAQSAELPVLHPKPGARPRPKPQLPTPQHHATEQIAALPAA
jgi:hypothetical protein